MSLPTSQEQALIDAWTRTYASGRITPTSSISAQPATMKGRGAADALAAWRRWHDATQQAHFTANEQCWYSLLERARVETLASQTLPGIAHNLAMSATTAPAHPAMAAVYQAARAAFQGVSVSNAILPGVVPPAPNHLLKRVLSRVLGQQVPSPMAPLMSDEMLKEGLRSASYALNDSHGFALRVAPMVKQLAMFYASDPDLRLTANAEDSGDQKDNSDADQGEEREEEGPSQENPSADGLAQELDERDDQKQNYAVFSRHWDITQSASYWLQPKDIDALKQLHQLDQRRVKQLAHRLQRRLSAASQRRWLFDQDEGRLDNRRLARLLDEKPNQRVFRVEKEAPMPEACVTLLVDQSGSMDLKRRQMAALAIELAVQTLEICNIRCEVLGFTTRYTADNPVFRQWQQRGKPAQPGRLNALQHIIYKAPEQPWRRTKQHLGLLLRQMPGHENIDGEALHWAASRLSRQPQPRKIMIVISDGAPFDKATAQANGRDFLERHLRRVISDIEQSPLCLAAIGTGQDVARFYNNALIVRSPEAATDTLFEQLGDLLAPANTNEGLS